jgi:hypothetical protein
MANSAEMGQKEHSITRNTLEMSHVSNHMPLISHIPGFHHPRSTSVSTHVGQSDDVTTATSSELVPRLSEVQRQFEWHASFIAFIHRIITRHLHATITRSVPW